ncbi:unnamed protein product [Gongylonema pulchrum]|uniref:BTB domain-containing protein n=1 Tax=Gongylonema pulchrum TaxID=637853 RepID=A0A183DTF6_9BILA|nr:unnamed protein product [Gongylonema pulchrum]
MSEKNVVIAATCVQQAGPDSSPTEDASNVQCVDVESDQQPSTSSGWLVAVRAECYNQQVTFAFDVNEIQIFAENVEVSRPQPPLRISRIREKYDGVSITIPVDGTLSRPSKIKKVRPKPSKDGFKATLRERNGSMYLNEWLADVHFVVGDVGIFDSSERIPAHSYILSIASEPFSAMFNGGFDRKNEIEIPDVEPAAFKILLKYLYSDDIELDATSALSTLYVAKKYMITYLAQAAIDFLDCNLKADNVCSLLAHSRLFDEEFLNRCWKLVDADAERVLSSDSFCDIDFSLLDQIISRKTLVVREKIVYEAAIKWAKAECGRRELPDLPQNLRDVLGNALYHIRFRAMTINEFANGPAKAGLLTCQETNDVFIHFAAEEKPSLPFPVNKRCGLRLLSCTRFQTVLQGSVKKALLGFFTRMIYKNHRK